MNYAKANPDKLTYGSAGVGSSVQMFAVLLEMRTGAKMRHVPYKGSAPALNDLLGGHLTMIFSTAASAAGRTSSSTPSIRNNRWYFGCSFGSFT